jgi:hypothetical protein
MRKHEAPVVKKPGARGKAKPAGVSLIDGMGREKTEPESREKEQEAMEGYALPNVQYVWGRQG